MGKGDRTKRWRRADQKRRFKARKKRHAKGIRGPSGHQDLKIVKKPPADNRPWWQR